MIEQIKNMLVGIVLAVLAYLKPIEGELWSLFLVFFLNFLFGYLSGMVANHEEWDNKKALRCVFEATVFFVLCAAVYVIGRIKGQMAGAVQCVSFITYIVLYFYGVNILRNCKQMFKPKTTPWHVINVLYYVLRFEFVKRVPFLVDYLNVGGGKGEQPGGEAPGTVAAWGGRPAADATGTVAAGGGRPAADATGTAAGDDVRVVDDDARVVDDDAGTVVGDDAGMDKKGGEV